MAAITLTVEYAGGVRIMDEILDEVLRSNRVCDDSGREYELHSNISRMEGEFVRDLILSNPVTRSIEIGCAYGVSSLFICGALARTGRGTHLIIDPYQSTQWHGIGVRNLTRAGLSGFTLIEKPSEIALPELLQGGSVFDFAFIDGWHTFDHVLVDFFYINRMLASGGILVFDDVDYPAVRRLVRYVSRYPSYRIVGSLPLQTDPAEMVKKRAFLRMSRLINVLPARLRVLFDDSVLRPDMSLNLNASMVALQKTGDDERNWDWYASF